MILIYYYFSRSYTYQVQVDIYFLLYLLFISTYLSMLSMLKCFHLSIHKFIPGYIDTLMQYDTWMQGYIDTLM